MTKNSTVQTITATLSPMLMPAKLFCEDPVVVRARMARMRAGTEQTRRAQERPQQNNVKMEKTRAHIATPELSCTGGDMEVVVATGCADTTNALGVVTCGR